MGSILLLSILVLYQYLVAQNKSHFPSIYQEISSVLSTHKTSVTGKSNHDDEREREREQKERNVGHREEGTD